MAISRVTTWTAGQTLTASALNSEFNNILDNPVSLWSPAAAAADMNGFELILDADADTSITADTDDQIDIRLNGADDFRFTANVFASLSGSRILLSQSTDIASAATVDLNTATGNVVDVTGIVTITALGTVQEGAVFFLQFDGALTLTHNATSLKLPGNANITTAAGDIAVVISEGAGNWRCALYTVRTDGPGANASTTDVLTGTNTTLRVTPNALAALWEEGTDIASAGVISVGEGGAFDVTGTTGITDIDFATDRAGRAAWIRFTGALTLTHNATSLILPTAANITTAANDTALFISEGTDNVRCLAYLRNTGAPIGGGWTTISTQTASASATINFTGLVSTYDVYRVLLIHVVPTTDNVALWLRTSTDNGATYDAGASDYQNGDGTAAAQIRVDDPGATSLGNAAGEALSGTVSGIGLSGTTTSKMFMVDTFNVISDGTLRGRRAGATGGARMAITDIDAIQFLMSSGTIASGTFVLQGNRR